MSTTEDDFSRARELIESMKKKRESLKEALGSERRQYVKGKENAVIQARIQESLDSRRERVNRVAERALKPTVSDDRTEETTSMTTRSESSSIVDDASSSNTFGFVISVPKPPTLEDIAEALREFSEAESDDSGDEDDELSSAQQDSSQSSPVVASILDKGIKSVLHDHGDTSSSDEDDVFAPPPPPRAPDPPEESSPNNGIPKIVQSWEHDETQDDQLTFEGYDEEPDHSTTTMSTLGSKSVNDYMMNNIPFFKRKELDRKQKFNQAKKKFETIEEQSPVVEQSPPNRNNLLDVLPGAKISDREKRKELLKVLKADIESGKKFKFIPFPFVPAPFKGTQEEDDEVNISSESSYDPSVHDSDTSGWLSSGESTDGGLLRDFSMSSTFDEGHSVKANMLPATNSEDAEEELLPLEKKELFVSESKANQFVGKLGGTYFLALLRGLCKDTPVCVTAIPVKDASTSTVEMAVDSLCGAYGSLYGIAQQSGANIKVLPPIKKRKRVVKRKVKRVDPVFPSCGGMYMISRRSGLTEEVIKSRQSYTVRARLSGRHVKGAIEPLPERYTDHECGATGGSLYLFMESVGATYAAAGSSLYMAELSGMQQ